MGEKYVIGVDLGGTKIATALCDSDCNILSKVKINTDSIEGEQRVMQRIKESIYQVIELSGVPLNRISGIGISSPGPLSVSKGMVIYVASLGWNNVPIRQLMQDEFKVPVYLENDCNAAAYGEKWLGAGRGYDNLIYITVSTGIGSGIIIDQKIYHGKHDAAGEFGHICIEYDGRRCSCGNKGCLQAYSSGTAIAQIARENISQAVKSKILDYSKNDVNNIDCLAVEKAAYEGDEYARNIWNLAGSKLGHGISILMQMYDPDIVVIGGGVSKAWDLFYSPTLNALKEHTYKLISGDMVIVPAQLGDDVGVLGAAMIVLKEQGLQEDDFLQLKIS